MANDWIYEKANALVKKYFTRDPLELTQILNIHLEEMNDTTVLLGMYQIIQRNRFIFLQICTPISEKLFWLTRLVMTSFIEDMLSKMPFTKFQYLEN